MIIYINKKLTNSSSLFDKDAILYKGENILVASDMSPKIKISLGEGRFLFIWGHVYAIRRQDGTMYKLDLSKGEDPLLRELAGKLHPIDIIKNLEGHFSGVLIKSESDIIIFADIYNRKDIFYVLKDSSLVVSTDLKAVVAVCPPKAYNQEALINIFHVYANYAPKKHTIYEGIYRLGVGEYIEYKQGKIGLRPIRFDPIVIQDYKDDKLNEYSELMHSVVEIRGSNECNWVSLSSGWDSSCILALLTELYGPSKVRAVIARVKYSASSGINNLFEVDKAKKIADYFSVPLDIVDIDYTKQEYLDFWKEIHDSLKANHLYSPFFNYNSLRIAEHVSKNSQGVYPLFNGEISDGVHNIGFSQFASILEHPDLNFREYSDKMAAYLFGPSFFSRMMKGESNQDFIYNIFKSRMSGSIFDDPVKMDARERKARFIESFFLSGQRIPFLSLFNSKLFTQSGMQRYQSVMRDSYLNDFIEEATPDTLYSWILHLYNSFHWQGSSVKGLSNASDHYNLGISMPFWDSRIQSFLSAMPESWGRGLDLNPTKYPLKWMLKNKVDYPYHIQTGYHSYLYDINPNWSGDADILYGSVGKPYFKEAIRKYQFEEVLQESHFNLSYLRKLTDDYINDKEVSGQERTDLKNLVSLSLVGWF